MNEEKVILPKLDSFTDARGTIQRLFEGKEFSSLMMIESKAGAVRANHWHRESYHLSHLLWGAMLYYELEPEKKDKEGPKIYNIMPGDSFFTKAVIFHSMEFMCDSGLLVASYLGRDMESYEKDTVRLDFDLTKL